jgi:probable F420-dependent oxidoreductase
VTGSGPRRFRFGVLVSDTTSGARLRDDARRIEALGYSTAFVPDHIAHHTPLSPVPTIAAIAQATERLRVGTLVLANDLRHPVQLARDAATLDLLSDGRLELGLGAGSMRSDHEPAGVQFDPLDVRVERLSESVAIIKRLIAGEVVTFNGRHYDVADVEGRPKTVQRPRPPLLIGGAGRRVLELAAREADIVSIVPPQGDKAVDLGGIALRIGNAMGPDTTDAQVGWVRAAAGSRLHEIELQSIAVIAYVTLHGEAVAQELAPSMGMSPRELMSSESVLLGSVSEITDELVARRERWGISYVVVPQAACEGFAPVVGRLAGT